MAKACGRSLRGKRDGQKGNDNWRCQMIFNMGVSSIPLPARNLESCAPLPAGGMAISSTFVNNSHKLKPAPQRVEAK